MPGVKQGVPWMVGVRSCGGVGRDCGAGAEVARIVGVGGTRADLLLNTEAERSVERKVGVKGRTGMNAGCILGNNAPTGTSCVLQELQLFS